MRRRRLRRRPGRARRWLWAAAAACLVVGLWGEWGLSSISPELTQEAARGYVLEALAQAVEEELEAQDDAYIQAQRDENGQVLTVEADAAALNRLKAGVLERLVPRLKGRARVWVPVGSLTPVALLNGRGFCLPVQLGLEGSADVSFNTQLLSAGVNQSLHRVTMTVRAQVYSQSQRFSACVEEETATVLSETLVVGPVPQVALGR